VQNVGTEEESADKYEEEDEEEENDKLNLGPTNLNIRSK